jgi:putative ABC transport system permease protein
MSMILNYCKVGSRILWKNKTYSLIHLTGLSIGLWACMMVATVVIDSISYDKNWTKGNEIYRIVSVNSRGEGLSERSVSSPSGLPVELRKNYPEVESFSTFSTGFQNLQLNKKDDNGVKTQVLHADTTVWEMLDIPILAGNPRMYVSGTSNIVISKTFAEKFFKGQDPVGKIIYDVPSYKEKPSSFLITGVMEDIPYNSHLRADIIRLQKTPREPLTNNGYILFSENYILMKAGTNMAEFTGKVNKWYADFMNGSFTSKFEFQAMQDIYLHSDFAEGQITRGNAKSIYVFSVIAMLLLFIACVNFVNLSTARAFSRLRETGIRKILSGSRAQLVTQMLTETLLLFAAAIIVSAILYELSIDSVEAFLGHKMILTITSSLQLAAAALAVILITGLLTGLYPALLISGFKSANTLKGMISSGSSIWQNWLRKGLVVTQLSVSIVIIIATIVIRQQLSFMEKQDLGYDKNNLLSIDYISWDGKAEAFKNELGSVPGVVNASLSQWLPTQGGGNMTRDIPDPENPKKKAKVWYIYGDLDLPQTLGLKLEKGRMLDKRYTSDALNLDSLDQVGWEKYEQATSRQHSMINGYAAKVMQIEKLDEEIKTLRTVPVGVIRNFNNESLHEPIKPTVIMARRGANYGGMLIRIEPGTEKQVMASVQRIWKKFFTSKRLNINSVREVVGKQYEAETKLQQLFMFFSTLTMSLSALGIFGLVVQAAEQRTKEVGIRKVLGASVAGIVALLSQDFFKLVALAIFLASPVAWYAIGQWLKDYPYRTEISWWIFAAAGGGAIFMTILTVSFQAVKAALANPVKSLRNE